MMTAMPPLLQAQLQQIQENPRLRLGLWAVLGIIVVYLLLVIADSRAATHEESRQLADRLARLARLSEEGNWTTRADEARGRLLDLEQRLWRTSSRGLAQAEFESWLLQQAEDAGFSRSRVDTESPVELEDAPGYWVVTSELQTLLDSDSLYRFLLLVEGNDKLVVVSQLQASDRGQTRASMTLSGYYRIDDA